MRRIRHLACRALDRPGGRFLLGSVATWLARREADGSAQAFYDGTWVQRFGNDYIATGKRFTFLHHRSYAAQLRNCEDFWLYLYRPRPGDVIIDAGAGVGSDTLVFSRAVGRQGRVLAIEAHPDTFALLEKTVKWNALVNVTLCHSAVIDTLRPVFIEDREDHEFNSIHFDWAPSYRQGAIQGASLDAISSDLQIDKVNFLKMNIEGAEALALDGMTELIDRTEVVCIACHDFRASDRAELSTRDDVTAFLTTHGFSVVRRAHDSRGFVRDHVHGLRNTVAPGLDRASAASARHPWVSQGGGGVGGLEFFPGPRDREAR